MSFPPRWLRLRALAISRREVDFDRRGFDIGDRSAREHLQRVASAVLDGYGAALAAAGEDELAASLDGIEAERRGFACEGAAMAMQLLDRLSPRPWRPGRWIVFLQGPGKAHPYMVHVGAGLALARLRKRLRLPGREFDPLLCWLVADGFGFHEGFFRGQAAEGSRAIVGRAHGYAARAFDQGFGRSLWFSCGGEAERIERAVRARPAGRWSDLWSGVGLACAYAGGVDRAGIEALRARAERFEPELAQGAAFAAQARARAGNPAAHTDLACLVLCGCGAERAAQATVRALEDLPADGLLPAYEVWRTRIRAGFGAREAA